MIIKTQELKALVSTLRELGITEYTNDGLSLKLGPVTAAPAKVQASIPAGACSHPMSRHAPDGTCKGRLASGAPCDGRCGPVIVGE